MLHRVKAFAYGYTSKDSLVVYEWRQAGRFVRRIRRLSPSCPLLVRNWKFWFDERLGNLPRWEPPAVETLM